MTQTVADDVAMAMQMAADDGAHRCTPQPAQQPGARLGLAHMVGVGAVCVVHVLAAED